jgi:signal transduction histidine kinase
LASISSLVQELSSLEKDPQPEADFSSEALKTINNHIERIAKTVRSLGDFARISSSEKTACSISEILDRTINLVKYDKRFKKVKLTTEIESVPPFNLNPDQIQQVFLNLILNALDAMPGGGELEISIKKEDSFAEVSFSDTGTGIDESVIDRIFDPFYTTKPLGKGTGLGLSICYGIIKEHNGVINVKNKPGGGTLFIIKLPMEESDG